jgi:rhamnose utilization protein RhaD (predicted bifunctional aldolase and dehydrogenase)
MDYLLRLARSIRCRTRDAESIRATHSNLGASALGRTILHACLPHKFVDHTHADAVLTITNAPEGERRIREIYGDTVVIIPYVMPGFDLARLCAREYPRQAGAGTIGMVLMNHGIFSFGERQAILRAHGRTGAPRHRITSNGSGLSISGAWPQAGLISKLQQAPLRRKLSDAAARP